MDMLDNHNDVEHTLPTRHTPGDMATTHNIDDDARREWPARDSGCLPPHCGQTLHTHTTYL